MSVSLVVAAVLHLAWVRLIANSGGDLAAQDAWAEFAADHPDYAYSLAWFGGMHPVSYSALSPYLMAVLGVRTTMVIAGTVSAGLLALLLVRSRAVRRPLWPALYGTVALICNAASGRVTFGLGMMFGLAAVAVVFAWPRKWRSRRWTHRLARGGLAALLSGLATASSPVAGLYVGIVAAALWLTGRRAAGYALGVTPAVVVGLSHWLFPFSGTMPMSLNSGVVPFLSGVAAFVFAPKTWRTVRIAGLLYAVAVVLVFLIPSQIGSNINRFGGVFGGVVLIAALPARKDIRAVLLRAVRRRRVVLGKWAVLAVAVVTVGTDPVWKSADDVIRTTPSASWEASELTPLLDRLAQEHAERGRVEVVPTSSHRESSAIAPHFNMARGWNRQADKERNPLFYDGTLDASRYHDWLRRWAVRYVVLPEDKPDGTGAGKAEAELVAAGQPYLDKVWSDAHWTLYKVRDPVPMADPPAVVRSARDVKLTIDVKAAGPVLIRIPYSPWLGLIDAEGRNVAPPKRGHGGAPAVNTQGCLVKEVQEAREGQPKDEWTVLHAPRPGTYRIGARYKLPRGTPCPDELVD
ncbi:DMT family transporter [Streptomyces sp. XD-27]|uniref:DMT family transporter n=1 Tax=Streptomyces sp. XD-27 TaxID=3062779 RepID=UPI0026F45F26|nr:DMT family transporter [Streptomyces sp. XD-27]WKX68977.1 DMT family transporter [Streptomyces sp. XD-27]